MEEDVFKREVLDRLITIESNMCILAKEHPLCRDTLSRQSISIAELKAAVKSAHHRINDMSSRIYKTVGISATIVGIFASVLTWALSK